MRPCHNYFLSFHIQNKVFHFTPLTQYIIVSLFSGFLQPSHRISLVLFYTITKAQHVLCISIPLFCRLELQKLIDTALLIQ